MQSSSFDQVLLMAYIKNNEGTYYIYFTNLWIIHKCYFQTHTYTNIDSLSCLKIVSGLKDEASIHSLFQCPSLQSVNLENNAICVYLDDVISKFKQTVTSIKFINSQAVAWFLKYNTHSHIKFVKFFPTACSHDNPTMH